MKKERSCVATPPSLLLVHSLLQRAARGGAQVPLHRDAHLTVLGMKAGGGLPRSDLRTAQENRGGGGGGGGASDPTPELRMKSQADAERGRGAEDEEPADGSAPPCSKAKSEEAFKAGDADKSARVIRPARGAQEKEEADDEDDDEEEEEEYASGRSESESEEDAVRLVLSHGCLPLCAAEDESHYITTHEIQLSELSDHEEDADLSAGSSADWDMEEGSQLFSFVDYASFDGDGKATGERSGSGGGGGGGGVRGAQDAATVSSLLESDLCDAAKFNSSDESVSKPSQQQQQQQQQQEQGEQGEQGKQEPSGNGTGQIHLSIRTTSRAINEHSNIQERGNILYHARRSGDMSHCVFRGGDGNTQTKCVIAAPGRLHFGGRLRGKEVTGFSSGASSAVSELDDADKEVRSLTARAFRSLAYPCPCPCFDAISFSTSSESSASERGFGLNRWSAFVDLKYANMNISQGLEPALVSHHSSSSGDNCAYKGALLAQPAAAAAAAAPTPNMFTLSGKPHSASSSQKIQLMGNFAQGHSGVIRLTETLNFRCNVKSGMSGGERRTGFAQKPAGSRSTDEVTNTLPSSQRRGDGQAPSKSMEDTHKKAIFASSLIKNVISKKMQFEQERKMERGEISEPLHTPPPSQPLQQQQQQQQQGAALQPDGDGHRRRGSRELHRQGSRFSESSSDYAIMCVDDLGDIVESGSCDRSEARSADAPQTNLEPTNEAAIDTKKGALEASKSTLLRSQNSAFRCWKDEELEFQKDHKNDKTPGEKAPSLSDRETDGRQRSAGGGGGKPTKMSHLFVPSIQVLSSDGEAERPPGAPSERGSGGGGARQRSDNTLYIAESRGFATSKSPEIKINLRSVRDKKSEPFGVSKLRAPALAKADDFKCQTLAAALKGEPAERVPHFMVRDIRDNKGKLQTPIHQVRDVRKLVKSSYHFVSLDNNNINNSGSTDGKLHADSHGELKKPLPSRNPASVSPIVIKCQSVNTNSNGKQSGNAEPSKCEPFESDTSPEGVANSLLPKAAKAPAAGAEDSGPRVESRAAAKRQDKASDAAEKKPESKMANRTAFEKLQAAVKTMEQLYVFEKNEWKRKGEPQPLPDSHVLPLLAGPDDQARAAAAAATSGHDRPLGRDSYPNFNKTPPAPNAVSPGSEVVPPREDRELRKSCLSPEERPPVRTGASSTLSLRPNATQLPFGAKSFAPKSHKLPMSLKISQAEAGGPAERDAAADSTEGSAAAATDNYLTIPVKSHTASSGKQASSAAPPAPPAPRPTPATLREQLGHGPKAPSSVGMETRSPDVPPATIYHSLPLGVSPGQPHMFCFSPAVTPGPPMEPFQPTQRKMLLDPTTGSYYLVDTPLQPPTRRLFDPETGQYVDVPVPQHPMTPLPMPMSPLALSPAAFAQTYMIYPGFMSPPSVVSARTMMSVQPDVESGEKAPAQEPENMYMESPFYMTTVKPPHQAAAAAAALSGVPNPAFAGRAPQGFSAVTQPLISITSQQGPRIIAPPSFDGTTMSFVVEHR